MNTRTIHRMRSLGMGLMVALVAAYAGTGLSHGAAAPAPSMAPQESAVTGVAATPGSTVARHLQERYAETFASCTKYAGDPDPQPALLCSGILLRASKRGPGFDIWNPNPGSPTPNGVSFSWLRQDANFDKLVFGYASGFIVLPYFYADNPSDGYTQLTVLCVYPFDGATSARTGDDRDGCGAVPDAPGTGPCQAQGINTAAQWIAKFGSGGMYGNQCGFRLLPQTPNAWQAFQAHWQIRQALSSWFHTQNEIMVRTWAQGDKRIPLEAFFYVDGSAAGLDEAKQNQVDFKARTGRWVPVIRISLPTSRTASAAFSFDTAGQGVSQ